MKNISKILKFLVAFILLSGGLFLLWAYNMAYFPQKPSEEMAVFCPHETPSLTAGQTLKTLSWNVQFMAGKGYVFWFEHGDELRPSPDAIAQTLDEVARIINAEQPDIILLQEMDNDAARTDHEDQTAKLTALISTDYTCSARTYYWRAKYLIHPKVLGSVGLQLATLSKYKIDGATRHALYEIPGFFLEQWFNVKRAILEVRMPIVGGGEFYALNTHLSAFAQGTDTMEHQVDETVALLTKLTAEQKPWVIGGDFNLLPPNIKRNELDYDEGKDLYKDESEITKIFDRFSSAATLEQLSGVDRALSYTHFPNNRSATGLDRTIDYIFYSPLINMEEFHVRQDDTQAISDHMPLVMTFSLN